MGSIGSLVFYLALLGVLIALCNNRKLKNVKQPKIVVAYTLLFIVAAIRFGIGNDYAGYAPGCVRAARFYNSGFTLLDGFHYYDRVEPAHVLINWVVRWMDYPFVGLYAIYSFLQVGMLYLILKRNNEHFWGLFIFIIGEFMFCSWDALRQFTAILIVTYSFKFVDDNKYIKFLFFIGIAYLFHNSAIFVLPFYLFRWAKVNRWFLIGIISIVTFLSVSGVIQSYQESVSIFFEYNYTDIYSGYADTIAAMRDTATSFAYKIRLLMVGIFYILILYYYPKGRIFNEIMLTIGVSLFIFATNNLTLMRISWYFWTIAIVMVGPSLRQMKAKNKYSVATLLIVMMIAIFSHDVITASNTRGCGKYTTIFTNNLDKLPTKQ